jgi:hypothetical protein
MNSWNGAAEARSNASGMSICLAIERAGCRSRS